MTKKEKAIFIIKLILELVVLILLILVIVHLTSSEDGVLAKIEEGDASEKLDTAIKTVASTDGMKLETAIRAIEGFDSLEINEETGEYNIKIDGQEFLVISKEILNGGEEEISVIENDNNEDNEKTSENNKEKLENNLEQNITNDE